VIAGLLSFGKVIIGSIKMGKTWKPWLPEEIEILKIDYINGVSPAKIEKKIGRTKKAVYDKAFELKITNKTVNNNHYTTTEDLYLMKYWGIYTIEEIEKTLGRTKYSLANRAERIGISKNNTKHKGYSNLTSTKYGRIKRDAKKRGKFISDDITPKYLWGLYIRQNKKCYLTGQLMPDINKASLDRIDNTKGYIKGNLKWCIKEANLMKLTHSLSDFIDLCKSVANHNNKVNT